MIYRVYYACFTSRVESRKGKQDLISVSNDANLALNHVYSYTEYTIEKKFPVPQGCTSIINLKHSVTLTNLMKQ